ncbi:MAG: VWA domain-containing protein, partial [Leptospirales bacterium]
DSPDARGLRKRPAQERRLDLPPVQELLEVDRKQIEDYTLGHNFEKIETADDFDGRWRDLENDDAPDENAEAIQEVRLAFRIRTTDAPDAVLSAEVAPSDAPDAADANVLDEGGAVIFFDEWDYRKQKYRRDHCRVAVRDFRDRRPGFASAVLARERKTFLNLDRRMRNSFQELEAVRRQTSGDEPDNDAVITALADLRAGRTPDERIYSGRRKRRRNISLHFLLDLSLSTDAYVADRRVLNVEREALTVFGEVLEGHACRFAVSAFYSRTRNDCVYLNIKTAREGWNATRDRIGGLEPRGYTRIGPAIRRTIQELGGAGDGQRWIVLFTDGRPNDYDRYEGRYGIRDVRQAIREAEAAGIQLQAFAVDGGESQAFHELLGPERYRILRKPADLPDALGDFFLRLNR